MSGNVEGSDLFRKIVVATFGSEADECNRGLRDRRRPQLRGDARYLHGRPYLGGDLGHGALGGIDSAIVALILEEAA